MTKDRRIIWSNKHLDVEDWKEAYQEFVEANKLDWNLNDERKIEKYMYEMNNYYLQDERVNLDIVLTKPIIVIGKLEFWNGSTLGYKMIDSCNIQDCLYSEEDYVEWYVDNEKNMRADASHHDGTNYYLYRTFKEDLTEDEMDDFQIKIIDNELTEEDIEKYTDSIGQYVCDIYGW